jgi:hypothetical protein
MKELNTISYDDKHVRHNCLNEESGIKVHTEKMLGGTIIYAITAESSQESTIVKRIQPTS